MYMVLIESTYHSSCSTVFPWKILRTNKLTVQLLYVSENNMITVSRCSENEYI
jgi:hypothetical protein